jgi:hypothetical protein
MSTTLSAHEAACESLGLGANGTTQQEMAMLGAGHACKQALPCGMLTVLQCLTQRYCLPCWPHMGGDRCWIALQHGCICCC